MGILTLERRPEFASILGDKRYNDRLSDIRRRRSTGTRGESVFFFARFEAINATGFPEQESPQSVA